MFNHFAAQKLARAGSASFGICEVFPFVDGSMLVDDNTFLEAAAQELVEAGVTNISEYERVFGR